MRDRGHLDAHLPRAAQGDHAADGLRDHARPAADHPRDRNAADDHRRAVIAGKKLAIVPILRAGIGMSDGLLELVPSARVGHIGVFRDPETHQPVEYLVRLPDTTERTFILCDPMVATGNSAVHAVDVLKKRGVPDEQIIFLALVAAPEGVEVFHKAHPNVKLYVASLDSHLNDHAYIVPGLGDAGDRIFGTK
jgi:uracil phosphoribosyltransferase